MESETSTGSFRSRSIARTAVMAIAIALAVALGVWSLGGPPSQVAAQAPETDTTQPETDTVEPDADSDDQSVTDEPDDESTGDESIEDDDELTEELDRGTSGLDGARRSDGRISGLDGGLSLQHAEIREFDLDDDAEEFVMFEFGGVIREVVDDDAFSVVGYSSQAEETSSSAQLSRGETGDVLVGFPEGTDLDQYSIATVDVDAVRDAVGEGNVLGAVPLDGSDVEGAGLTAAPELVGIRIDDTLNRVTYELDRELEESSPSPSDFGYYTLDGEVVEGSTLVTVEDEEVRVDFDEQVDDGVRFFAKSEAVDSRQDLPSIAGSIGEETTSPDLESVDREGETRYDYTFTETVTEIDPSRFLVRTDSGRAIEGDGWTRVDGDTVRVYFPELDRVDSDEVALGAVDEDAVVANDGSDAPNTIGSVAVGSSGPSLGRTSGPDLVDVSADESTGEVEYEFDEQVSDQTDVDAEDFFAVTESGDLVEGSTFVEVDDDRVIIHFPQNVTEAADAYAVDAGAVEDFVGDPSSMGLLHE